MVTIASMAPDAVRQENNVISRFLYAFMGHLVCMKELPSLMADEHVPEVKLVILPSFTVKCSKIQTQAKCNSPRLNWAAASGLKYVMQWSCNTCNCSGL